MPILLEDCVSRGRAIALVDSPARDVADWLTIGRVHEVPVVSGGHLVGVITAKNLPANVQTSDLRAQDVMLEAISPLRIDRPLSEAKALVERDGFALVVDFDGAFIGLIDEEELARASECGAPQIKPASAQAE
jgi:CBS domain-containing protein